MKTAEELTKKVIQGLANKFEDLIIEGLKLKGFEFDNRLELENFIKNNCTCIDSLEFKQRIYSVNNIPFLLHNYEVIYEPIVETNKDYSISANYGSYSFL